MKTALKCSILLSASLIALYGCRLDSRKIQIKKADYRDIGLFLAGKDIHKTSSLSPLTLIPEYIDYKNQIEANWVDFQEKNLKEIERWRFTNVPRDLKSRTVFYPFSGPDIINALAFYPDADLYIMVGLEPPGKIPQPLELTTEEILPELEQLKESLGSILKWNFFRTKGMEVVVGKGYFNGIGGILMLMLARYGYYTVDIRHIWMDSEGQIRHIQSNVDPEVSISGIELIFCRENTTSLKKIYFFQVDISDGSLQVHTNYIRFIKNQERLLTLLKAASYLMHMDDLSFIITRSLLLSRSDIIIQDDSGIPLNHLTEGDWRLLFYGTYTEPIPLFELRFQKDLLARMKYESRGALKFSFGYYLVPEKSHLMMAIRNAD